MRKSKIQIYKGMRLSLTYPNPPVEAENMRPEILELAIHVIHRVLNAKGGY